MELVKELGTGTYATVYSTRTEGKALKVPSYKMAYLDNIEEIDILCRLRHPYLIEGEITILDAKNPAHPEAIGLIMPQAKGDLADILTKPGYLPFHQQLDIMWELASALSFLHSQGYLHLDIKPSNVLLRPEGGVWLGDFGLSCYVESTKEGFIDPKQPYVSVPYRPPENLRSSKAPWCALTDVWSLGVLFLELLAQGHFLYSEDFSETYTLAKIQSMFGSGESHKRDLIENMLRQVPRSHREPLTELLAGMLQVTPGLRWSMDKVGISLSKLAGKPLALGTIKEISRSPYTYSASQLKILRQILLNIPQSLPLGCYFLAQDLILRTFTYLPNDAPVKSFNDYAMIAYSLACFTYRIYDLGLGINRESLLPGQRLLISHLKGVIVRPYLFQHAHSLNQLYLIREQMPLILHSYPMLDTKRLCDEILSADVHDEASKRVLVKQTLFKQGPGF